MKSGEFVRLRKVLNKTQKETAQLLGVSIKAIHSYEQGWRSIPAHVERQLLFLVSRKSDNREDCWQVMACPEERKLKCTAWEFNSGKLCWFINGTLCEGEVYSNWHEKMKYCRACKIFSDMLSSDT